MVEEVKAALATILDPELNISIVELGLIYEVAVDKDGQAVISMTLTTLGCPLFPVIERQVKEQAMSVAGVKGVDVQLTFDPPWDLSKMSEKARAQLGMM